MFDLSGFISTSQSHWNLDELSMRVFCLID